MKQVAVLGGGAVLVEMGKGEAALVDALLMTARALAGHPQQAPVVRGGLKDASTVRKIDPAPKDKGKPVTTGVPKTCPECHAEFVGSTSAVCCGDQCRAARLKRQKEAHYERSKRQTAAANRPAAPFGSVKRGQPAHDDRRDPATGILRPAGADGVESGEA